MRDDGIRGGQGRDADDLRAAEGIAFAVTLCFALLAGLLVVVL